MSDIKEFKDDAEVRAHVIYVYHFWRLSNTIVKTGSDYFKRDPESIKNMEDVRQTLHWGAVDYLKALGFNETEISVFIECECEKETKRELRDLNDGECYCGCCRLVLNNSDFMNHSRESVLHDLLKDEVYSLSVIFNAVQQRPCVGDD